MTCLRDIDDDMQDDEYFEIEREAYFLRLALLVAVLIAVALCSGRCG